MEIRYPIRKADGREYEHYDELMTDMKKMAHGLWLVGVNRYWHGGVHVGDTSSPASVLSQETPEKSVPLQCMADGEVVAWRVCRDYTQALLYENHAEKMELRHSSTFLLVKSVHKPDEEDAASWLDLYHLYMQMAPLSEYPKRKLYRVTEKGHGVRLRQHSRGVDVRELAPDVIKNKHGLSQTLSRGDVLAMLRESSFMLKGNSEPFGLMQKVTGGIPAGPLFWVSMRPEFMEPDGECHVCLPVWMHHALNHGVFDEVVLPPAPLKVAIKAGDAVGFLGAQDISENGYTRESRTEYKAHIELLSTDAHVPDVLANIKDIKSGAQYVKLKLKRPFYLRNGDGDDATFSPMSAITRKDGDMIFRRETTHPFRDKDGVVWFQIRPHTWIHQDDVDQLSQHDLTQLNFTAIVAEPTIDFSHPLDESWVTEAVKSLASHFDAEKGPDSAQAKTFFDGLLGQLRARNAGGMTEWDSSELNKRLFNVLHSSQMNLPELTRRLVVKHDSDWHGGSENSRWSRLFGDGWQPMNGVNRLFLQKNEWMSKVPPFMEGKPVWHFHPLEFLNAIKDDEIISLKEARVRAFMRMLRVGEGTVGEYGYETLFGGQSFIKDFHKDFSDHPQISITRGGLTSSAAGAYQVMGYTWNDKSMVSARSKYGINDFSPKSQDEFCIILFKMKRKGSLDKIASGDIDGALESLSYEWASLPPGRYGQPSKSRSEAIDLFEKYLNEEINGKTDLHIPIGYILGIIG
ncbi:glycoside hydrolase family 104 protein [Yersinia kristensenii]|uniref:glycoside hydrolase family 24 protein n=1 Tax=Yersinia kristensenii TaxID=28152 RepID=UPI001C956802|nr:glycoside hydrolase family 104 protein [Yersinia kristensenii]